MAQKSVTLKVVSNNGVDQIQLTGNPVTLDKDDWITFIAGDSNIYDVRIDKTALFNTKKTVLKYQVYDRNPQDSPTTKQNTVGDAFDYIIDAYTSDDITGNTDPNAPPRIIINPHT
jgi:hypothetical protein